MSLGMRDTGDDNPFASARIVRTMLLMLLFLMVFTVLGQLLHAIPPINSGLAGLLARFYQTRSKDAPPPPNTGGGTGAAGKPTAQVEQAFAVNGGPASVAQAHAAVTALVRMQETIERLPEAERTQARAARDKLASELFKARLKAYLSAPPAKKRAELDRQIRQDELMRKAWKASRKLAAGTAAGEGFPGGGGGWPGEGGAGGGDDDSNRHLKNFLDSTSPEQRARYEEYRRAMEARRQQWRLPP